MTADIDNIDIYLKRMAATLSDKCWWVERMPPEIDTVVDFGCAQGDLAIYIEGKWPGRFGYIGVDNAPRMLELARQNMARYFGVVKASFRASVAEAAEQCDPARTVLVLNSVMHEVFSYVAQEERRQLLGELFGCGFCYVAIRDMHMPLLDGIGFDAPAAIAAVEASSCADLWHEYDAWLSGPGRREAAEWTSPATRVAEFLLKYKYTDNWAREMRETYYWEWLRSTEAFWRAGGYGIERDERFHIPFLRQQILQDFGIDLPADTHRKVLLRHA